MKDGVITILDTFFFFFQVSVNTKGSGVVWLYTSPQAILCVGEWLYKHPQAIIAEINYKTDFGLNIGIGGEYLFMKEYRVVKLIHNYSYKLIAGIGLR